MYNLNIWIQILIDAKSRFLFIEYQAIFFNIVAEMLVILIERAKVDGQIYGVTWQLINDGLSIL
jgi:uncharacterized LabA/DUF88 family protein